LETFKQKIIFFKSSKDIMYICLAKS